MRGVCEVWLGGLVFWGLELGGCAQGAHVQCVGGSRWVRQGWVVVFRGLFTFCIDAGINL